MHRTSSTHPPPSAPTVRQLAWRAATPVCSSVTLTSSSPPHAIYPPPSNLRPCTYSPCMSCMPIPPYSFPASRRNCPAKGLRTPNLSRRWKHAWKTVPAQQEPMASGVRVGIDCRRSGHVEGGRRSVGRAKRSGVEESGREWEGGRPTSRCVAMLWNGRRHACEGDGRCACKGGWRLKGGRASGC